MSGAPLWISLFMQATLRENYLYLQTAYTTPTTILTSETKTTREVYKSIGWLSSMNETVSFVPSVSEKVSIHSATRGK